MTSRNVSVFNILVGSTVENVHMSVYGCVWKNFTHFLRECDLRILRSLFGVLVSPEEYTMLDRSKRRPLAKFPFVQCNAWFDNGYLFIRQFTKALGLSHIILLVCSLQVHMKVRRPRAQATLYNGESNTAPLDWRTAFLDNF